MKALFLLFLSARAALGGLLLLAGAISNGTCLKWEMDRALGEMT